MIIVRIKKANIEENEEGLSEFLNTRKRTLGIRAPSRQKYARGNHIPFMSKTLSKEIMTRTRLRNNSLKDIRAKNKREYSKQRSYCVSLLRKSNSGYFGNLNEKKVIDNKTFWKTIRSFLSDKVTSTQKMTLIEKKEIIMATIMPRKS